MKSKKLEILEPVDLSELLVEYSKMWVILSFDEKSVLKSGKTYEEVSDLADQGIAMLVPDLEYPFAPSITSY